MSKPVVLVSGITGAQGGSVAQALLADGKYAVRGITRNLDSEKAKALTAKGFELLKADGYNFEEMKTALQGAYGFFLMTNFLDPIVGAKEFEFGKILVDAAKAAGVKHVVTSVLSDCEAESNGKYKVPHFTMKAKIRQYADQQLKGVYVSHVAPASYFQNFTTVFAPKEENGELVWTAPKSKTLTTCDIDDIGPIVVECFNNPKQWDRKFIPMAGDHMPVDEYMTQFTEVTGKKARWVQIPREIYATFYPGAGEIAEMFGWFDDYTYFGNNEDLSLGRKAYPGLKNFKQWLKHSGFNGTKTPS